VTHDYLSTACHHDLHDRCRQVCKFCDVGCRCDCHPDDHEDHEDPPTTWGLSNDLKHLHLHPGRRP
jgi:hypothetical protein